MNNKGFLSIIFRAAIFIFLLSYAGTATAGIAGPFASGHGNLIIEGERRTFSFHARELKNGRVIGSLVLKNRNLGIRAKAIINCLDIDGNQATMSGVITQINGDYSSLIGDDIWFRVVDNGEGFRNTTDQITLVIVELDEPPSAICTEDVDVDLQNILGGNIQVNP